MPGRIKIPPRTIDGLVPFNILIYLGDFQYHLALVCYLGLAWSVYSPTATKVIGTPPRPILPPILLAYRFLVCVVSGGFQFFVPTPFVSEPEPHAPFGADDRDDVRLAAPVIDTPLADADQAEEPCLPERVANRGRACASSSRELRHRTITIAPVPLPHRRRHAAQRSRWW
jgi:hypothetical protein